MIKDINYYKNLGVFNNGQLEQIFYGLKERLDVLIYAKPEYSDTQMFEIRVGLIQKLDISIKKKA